MSLIRFLIIIGIGTVLSWAAWVMVLTSLDPMTGGVMTFILFYGSLFLSFFGSVTLIGFFLRYWLEREQVLFRQIGIALRHGMLCSAGASVALLLQGQRLLSLWTGLALFILLIMTELFFLAGQTRRPASTN